MNYLNYFFNPAHLFSLRPRVMETRAIIILGVVALILIGAAVALHFTLPKIKDGLKIKGYRRLIHLLATSGGLLLTYLFFAWQGIALLAARFWLLIILLIALIWLAFILRYLYVVVPKRRAEIDGKRKFERYIP